ncbi:MAG: hypothetical protein JWP10_386 [Nocardioidaceae bacterium]|nr:hypothetical protein [Nocardioidaceae bacterium]
MRRVRLIGIGSGHPDQITVEAVRALNEVDYFIVADKANGTDDLVRIREDMCRTHIEGEWRIVEVRDPERDRDPVDYDQAVADWHEARAASYEQVLLDHPGDAGFLVWGDPAFYDSAIRIVDRIHARGNVIFDYDVIPGISSFQVLAARHRIVLNEIGQPILVTTGRKLAEAVAAGHTNIVVMLNAGLDALRSLSLSKGDWTIYWGANLGTAAEVLVSGKVSDVLDEIEDARSVAKARAGWVMDVYVLRHR